MPKCLGHGARLMQQYYNPSIQSNYSVLTKVLRTCMCCTVLYCTVLRRTPAKYGVIRLAKSAVLEPPYHTMDKTTARAERYPAASAPPDGQGPIGVMAWCLIVLEHLPPPEPEPEPAPKLPPRAFLLPIRKSLCTRLAQVPALANLTLTATVPNLACLSAQPNCQPDSQTARQPDRLPD